MTQHSYISIIGRKLGLISGGSIPVSVDDKREPEHIDKIRMLSFNIKLTKDRDLNPVFEYPFFLTKLYDRSTPMLIQALMEQEVVDCEIIVHRESPSGSHEKLFTINLDEGMIVTQDMENRPAFLGDGEEIVEIYCIHFRDIRMVHH
ncbi:MAG: type secretion system effector, Hcp1 family [Pseudomonas sp.]|nr:type secretion system effector, Hcp1 family [Pseudomonas sp.]